MSDFKTTRIIKNTMPTVVSVVLSKKVDDLKKELASLKPAAKNKIKIPEEKITSDGTIEIGGGSGFLVDASGIVLTNKHVIAESNVKYKVVTDEEESFEAELLARDPVDDVAILKIIFPENKTRKFPYLKLGNSSDLDLGQTVLAIGNALGIFKNTVSMGIISGLSRSVKAKPDPKEPTQEMRGLIQTDAAINPGNSGGPLVDMSGKVIGINAAVVAGAQNISFAIPINTAKRDLIDLKKFGRIRRPLLGVRYVTLNEEISKKMSLPVESGAYITKEHPMDEAVIKGTPADKAGLKENDIILEWNGKPIKNDSIQDLLENSKVGDEVRLKILRGNKNFETSVILSERK